MLNKISNMKEPFVIELFENKKVAENIEEINSKNVLVEVISRPKKMCIFGACLDQLISATPDLNVPFILSRLCNYIEKYGLQDQSLFQIKEKDKIVEDLKRQFDEYGDAPLESQGDIPAATKLLKMFLEELPEPLVPAAVCTTSLIGVEGYSKNSVEFSQCLRVLVDKLPFHTFSALKYLCNFFMLVAEHADMNGLSCSNIGLIFGPLIFRVRSDDSGIQCSFASNATCSFISDYYCIFEEKDSSHEGNEAKILHNYRKVAPFPSSVVPVMNLKPLNIVIPLLEVKLNDERNCSKKVPTLVIERQFEDIKEDIICDSKIVTLSPDLNSMKMNSALQVIATRKRKDNIPLQLPATISDKEVGSTAYMELKESWINQNKHSLLVHSLEKSPMKKDITETNEMFIVDPRAGDFEGDSSPHPPNPKRRELEILDCKNESGVKDSLKMEQSEEDWLDGNEDDLHDLNFDPSMIHSEEISPFQRSSSCPLSMNYDSEDTSSQNVAPLSWNKLFDSIEPVRAHHRLSWPILNMVHDDRNEVSAGFNLQNPQAAPLSPSAFRPHLSHRSAHLDPKLPPSPPDEQENFVFTVKDDKHNEASKILSKKIHSLKKKLKRFEKRFEKEYGYKPSCNEKVSVPETKKWMDEIYKLKQKLKVLMEESEPVYSSSTEKNSILSNKVHVLEDTTNCLEVKDFKDSSFKSKPTVETSRNEAMRSLDDDRKLLNRPENLEFMTKKQVEDEKIAIQKVLLKFESIHGKLTNQVERNKIRPLYDRYRSVKHLVRSSSFSVNTTNVSLQPIMEHETMDFSTSHKKVQTEWDHTQESIYDEKEINPNDSNESHSPVSLHKKYNNSNLHELSVTELASQHSHALSEKRCLRKLLREFEADFLRSNGRKVQKEDKAAVEEYYIEYKFIKARIKLLEALLSKHGVQK